jgi:hypothetical protein
MPTSRTALSLLAAATTSLALAVPTAAVAAPEGWTEPAQVTGTAGVFDHASATSPSGADLVAWVAGPSGDVRVEARLRIPGGTTWLRVPLRAQHRLQMQGLQLEPTPDGDFWLAWQQEDAEGMRNVYAMRLDVATRQWSTVVRPFGTSVDDEHGLTELAVSGRGAVLIGGFAAPTDGSGYRSMVAVKDLDRPWLRTYLSPEGEEAGATYVAAGAGGHLVAGWVSDRQSLADMTVHAAVRTPAAGSAWQSDILSPPGSGQRVEVAVGPSGRAAALWATPANAETGLQIATMQVRPAAEGWGIQNVDPVGGPSPRDPRAVVDAEGDVTILYGSASGGATPVVLRELTGFAMGPAGPLTAEDDVNTLDDAALRTGNLAGVLTHAVDGVSAGLRYRTTSNGMPGTVLELTDGGVEENHARLGYTATGRATVIWARGLDSSSIHTTGQSLVRPAVVRSATNSTTVARAAVTGKVKVGKVVTCRTGYWVEARGLTYRWTLKGTTVRGAAGETYKVKRADRGRLACRVVADNAAGSRALTSPPRAVQR